MTDFILQNMLLMKDVLPTIKVADFSLAKAVNGLTMLRVCPLTCHLFTLASGWVPTCIISLFFLYR